MDDDRETIETGFRRVTALDRTHPFDVEELMIELDKVGQLLVNVSMAMSSLDLLKRRIEIMMNDSSIWPLEGSKNTFNDRIRYSNENYKSITFNLSERSRGLRQIIEKLMPSPASEWQ